MASRIAGRTLGEKLIAGREVDAATSCWNWTRAVTSGGYGQIRFEGSSRFVHRLAYALWVGDPDGRDICHHCDNKRCFNPDHLFAGTAKDNMMDAAQKGLLSDGEKSHFARLTWGQVHQIRALKRRGVMQRKMARQFDVSEATISRVVRHFNWKER